MLKPRLMTARSGDLILGRKLAEPLGNSVVSSYKIPQTPDFETLLPGLNQRNEHFGSLKLLLRGHLFTVSFTMAKRQNERKET